MHTHTTFGDGKSSPEEMVCSALDMGCATLGISEHAYSQFAGAEEWCMGLEGQKQYAAQVLRLREKYAGRIKLLLGVELDYYSELPSFDRDYTIGSVHMIKKGDSWFAVDASPEELRQATEGLYANNPMALVREYYELVADVVNKTHCDIVGHFDLITKFNQKYPLIDTCSREYRDAALAALDAVLDKCVPIEINTGAVLRGFRTEAYPEEFILRRIAERGGAVILSSDAHSAQGICFGFDKAFEYASFCGVKNFVTY